MPAIEELTINSKLDFELLPNLENLSLNSDCESLNKIADLSLRDQKPLAGVVTSVAKVIGLIVVKPPEPRDVLLYIGSPVFFRNSNFSNVSDDVKLGWIIDVFGPACEPYYCVKPGHNYIEMVREGSEIFYSPDHPRTTFIRIKLTDNSRYTVMYSSTRPLGDYKCNGKMFNHAWFSWIPSAFSRQFFSKYTILEFLQCNEIKPKCRLEASLHRSKDT